MLIIPLYLRVILTYLVFRGLILFAYLNIDFRRAFDSVVHSKLYLTLKSLGVSGNLLHWISDFLSSRLQAVRVANSTWTFYTVRSGFRQGNVLVTILFTRCRLQLRLQHSAHSDIRFIFGSQYGGTSPFLRRLSKAMPAALRPVAARL